MPASGNRAIRQLSTDVVQARPRASTWLVSRHGKRNSANWLVALLTVAPALVSGSTAIGTVWFTGARKGAIELERWRRREEAMRLLRWAADKTASATSREVELGASILDALDASKPAMLQIEDQGIVDAALKYATSGAQRLVARYDSSQGDYDVEVMPDG